MNKVTKSLLRRILREPEIAFFSHAFLNHCQVKKSCRRSPAASSVGMDRPAVHLAVNCKSRKGIIITNAFMY